ncbi:MAG: tannase/feruloyl esterase family alpha/beta hydrolase [Ruminococcaceae bacterium]|nr:tannase/feruloyl esterase family alpha/beta hydrolase [Oscillospiraceae bacterium]
MAGYLAYHALAFSGSADPCVPFPDALGYCNRVAERLGRERAAECFRWFLLPGKDHGAQGRGSNCIWNNAGERAGLLTIIRRWREDGIAPDTLTAARVTDGETVFAREVKAYAADLVPGKSAPPVCGEAYLK